MRASERRHGRVEASRGAGYEWKASVAGVAGIVLGGMILVALVLASAGTSSGSEPPSNRQAPPRLADTGLYSDFSARTIDRGNLSYEPQYPLWTDGAAKKRWIHIPAGTAIDASDLDAWRFPAGTKLWKEFRFKNVVETRYIEHVGGEEWIYATYVWNQDGSDAVLAPRNGIRGAAEIPGGARHDIPGYYDCLSCHEGQPNRVLGFTALQLSPDRDPLAPHACVPGPEDVDLADLIERGLIRGLPEDLLRIPPRIAAPSPRARAALGYLHANCGTCHNSRGPLASLGFSLEAPINLSDGCARSGAASTAVDQLSRFRPPDHSAEDSPRVAAGEPERSVLIARMASREASLQMPPLGTHLVDETALALVNEWIREDLRPGDLVSETPSCR